MNRRCRCAASASETLHGCCSGSAFTVVPLNANGGPKTASPREALRLNGQLASALQPERYIAFWIRNFNRHPYEASHSAANRDAGRSLTHVGTAPLDTDHLLDRPPWNRFGSLPAVIGLAIAVASHRSFSSGANDHHYAGYQAMPRDSRSFISWRPLNDGDRASARHSLMHYKLWRNASNASPGLYIAAVVPEGRGSGQWAKTSALAKMDWPQPRPIAHRNTTRRGNAPARIHGQTAAVPVGLVRLARVTKNNRARSRSRKAA